MKSKDPGADPTLIMRKTLFTKKMYYLYGNNRKKKN
jgi:hypothetical protein